MLTSRFERELDEQERLREAYLRSGPQAVTAPPGPGRRPEELERLEAARQAAQAARDAARTAAAERAEEERRSALEQAEALRMLKARVDTELGLTRAELRRATDAADFEAALAAAARLVALAAVAEEVPRAGKRYASSHRGTAWYAVSAGRV